MSEPADRLVTICALIARHKMVSRSDVVWLIDRVEELRVRVKNIEDANDELVSQINVLQSDLAEAATVDAALADVVSVYEDALGVKREEEESE